MAFTATNSTAEPRSYSVGPWKVQSLTYSVASGDTTGTITADALSSAEFCIITGPAAEATAAPTYATNVVTIAFADPLATRYGTILVYGR